MNLLSEEGEKGQERTKVCQSIRKQQNAPYAKHSDQQFCNSHDNNLKDSQTIRFFFALRKRHFASF